MALRPVLQSLHRRTVPPHRAAALHRSTVPQQCTVAPCCRTAPQASIAGQYRSTSCTVAPCCCTVMQPCTAGQYRSTVMQRCTPAPSPTPVLQVPDVGGFVVHITASRASRVAGLRRRWSVAGIGGHRPLRRYLVTNTHRAYTIWHTQAHGTHRHIDYPGTQDAQAHRMHRRTVCTDTCWHARVRARRHARMNARTHKCVMDLGWRWVCRRRHISYGLYSYGPVTATYWLWPI